MSILDDFFRSQRENIYEGWKTLTKVDQLDQVIEDSHRKPVVIFKHSISCGLSAMVKHGLQENWDFDAEDLDFYYLDLITHRQVSNLIAKTFHIIHHSPQLILLKDGEAVYNTSHHRISVKDLRAAIEKYT